MSEASQNSNPSPEIAGLLSSLLSNPEALSKISGILSKYTSEENSNNPPQSTQNIEDLARTRTESDANGIENPTESPTEQVFKNSENTFDFSKIASLFGGEFYAKKSQNKEQIALLLAIRPYLSPRRKELIDTFIKFSRFGVILNKFNQNGGQNVLQ